MNPHVSYAGCPFESELHARWAVFFDRLSIGWQYRPDDTLSSSLPLTPSFRLRLPNKRVLYAVVDHDAHGAVRHPDREQAQRLADTVLLPVLWLAGPPDYRMDLQNRPVLSAPLGFGSVYFTDAHPVVNEVERIDQIPMRLNPDVGTFQFLCGDDAARDTFGSGLVDAIIAARSATFSDDT
jgi:hypothetical protein